jgi:hypothetical protein
MKKFVVYTYVGDYPVVALNAYYAKLEVFNLMMGRVDMDDMLVVYKCKNFS